MEVIIKEVLLHVLVPVMKYASNVPLKVPGILEEFSFHERFTIVS